MFFDMQVKELKRKIDELTEELVKMITNCLFSEMEPVLVKRNQSIQELLKLAAHQDKSHLAAYVRVLQESNERMMHNIRSERDLIRGSLSNFDHIKKYLE